MAYGTINAVPGILPGVGLGGAFRGSRRLRCRFGQRKPQDLNWLIHRQDTKQQFAEAQSLGALQNSIIPLQLILTLTIPSNPASFPLIRYSLLRDIQPQLTRIQDTIQDKQQSFAAMAHELPYAAVFLAITAKASGRHIATQDLGSASPTA
ncbi:MAG: hypothetical protein NT158_10560 [Cyanobacteria bacterium]|nr:hypothetical protein [Cyanobacteriota bacterium]